MPLLIRARWVVPVSSPPVENGAVVVEGDRIVAVGASAFAEGYDGSPLQKLDLGDAVLFPGLVNAHCHLEFSTSPFPLLTKEGVRVRSFTEWVKEMSAVGANLRVRPGEGRHTGLPLQNAIDALLRGGTTTVADHCNPDRPPIETPLRRIVFWEVLGAHPERAQESLRKARQRARDEGGFITPHSLYAVHEEVLEEILRGGREGLFSIHILESADEEQFFRKQTGPLAIYVQERGGDVKRPAVHHWLRPGLILVHGNYLDDAEIGLLQRGGAGVIHCPGSHRFFEHRRFPLEALKEKGIRIGLGTDSLASNEDLNLLREMRLLRENYPALLPEEILRMATLEGAGILKMDREIGSIETGKKADLVAVRIKGHGSNPFENILAAEAVSFSMIDGKEVLCTTR